MPWEAEEEQQHSEQDVFSAHHLPAAPQPSRQVFQQAGQGLEADLSVKPAPGIILLSPFPSALSGRAIRDRARSLSLYTPLLPQRPRQGTAAWELPSRFLVPLGWGGGQANIALHHQQQFHPDPP